MKIVLFILLSLATSGIFSAVAANDSAEQECRFTTSSYAVCSISFVRLIAHPEKFDGKYVAVVGFLAVDNGRLAVFSSETAYVLNNSQESFSITSDLKKRIEFAKKYGGTNIRIVGKFSYKIAGDQSGIGYIHDVINIYKIPPRQYRPEDQGVTGTAEEVSNLH